MKKNYSVILLILLSGIANAQILSEQDAVNMALKRSPLLNVAVMQVKQQKQLQGSSFNLADPEITLESPTGEFMTVGVSQSFEFPSVYIKQSQLARQQTVLAEKGKVITEAEVIKQVKSAYLNLQFYNAIWQQLKSQDSVYFRIADAAGRQFTAGQVDFVEKTFAASQYGEIHNKLTEFQSSAEVALQQLQLYTGITDSIVTAPLVRSTGLSNVQYNDTAQIISSPVIQYSLQTQSVAEKSLELERNKLWPGFVIGYMNQGEKDSEIPMRIRAGVNIPLWFWQYNSSIKAARTSVEISRQNTLLQQQNLVSQIHSANAEVFKYQSSLTYYENTGIKQAEELISSSERMFSAGQYDYITYLRTLSEAYSIKVKYFEMLHNVNQSMINLNYLKGQ